MLIFVNVFFGYYLDYLIFIGGKIDFVDVNVFSGFNISKLFILGVVGGIIINSVLIVGFLEKVFDFLQFMEYFVIEVVLVNIIIVGYVGNIINFWYLSFSENFIINLISGIFINLKSLVYFDLRENKFICICIDFWFFKYVVDNFIIMFGGLVCDILVFYNSKWDILVQYLFNVYIEVLMGWRKIYSKLYKVYF